MEEFFSGYCRVLDAARTVLADSEEGDADCEFPACAYAADCPIAARLREFLSTEAK